MTTLRMLATLTLIVLATSLFGCQPPAPPAEPGEAVPLDEDRDRAAVVEAHRALVAAYEAGDVDAFVDLLDTSGELLIYHPAVDSRFDGVEDVRRSMGRMFEKMAGATWTDHHALVTTHGDAAWLTAQVLIELPEAEPFIGRATEIFVRTPEGWKLAHAHWSAPQDGGS